MDSWGKANEKGSANPAIYYLVMLNYYLQLTFSQNREEPCCYFAIDCLTSKNGAASFDSFILEVFILILETAGNASKSMLFLYYL